MEDSHIKRKALKKLEYDRDLHYRRAMFFNYHEKYEERDVELEIFRIISEAINNYESAE